MNFPQFSGRVSIFCCTTRPSERSNLVRQNLSRFLRVISSIILERICSFSSLSGMFLRDAWVCHLRFFMQSATFSFDCSSSLKSRKTSLSVLAEIPLFFVKLKTVSEKPHVHNMWTRHGYSLNRNLFSARVWLSKYFPRGRVMSYS